MKLIIPFALFVAALFYGAQTQPSFQPIAVIELFTSEGCSSCPPADKLLAQTIEAGDKNVFALSFHVDYWNRLGWKDSFSSKQFSERQGNYSHIRNSQGVYTPQMVVNGTKEFVGSDKSELDAALHNALNKKATSQFNSLKISFNESQVPSVSYELQGAFNNCEINFAMVSLVESTAVKRGENSGRQLRHVNVVRQLITVKAGASGNVNFEPLPMPAKNNLAIVAYVQDKASQQIIGAAMVKP